MKLTTRYDKLARYNAKVQRQTYWMTRLGIIVGPVITVCILIAALLQVTLYPLAKWLWGAENEWSWGWVKVAVLGVTVVPLFTFIPYRWSRAILDRVAVTDL